MIFRRSSYISLGLGTALMLQACAGVSKTTQIAGDTAKITGKAAYGTGKGAVKAGKVTGRAVGDAGEFAGDVIVSTGSAATAPVNTVTRAPEASDVNSVERKDNLGEAILSPLYDVNVRRKQIPDILTEMGSPYAQIQDTSCPALAQEIAAFDEILGPDMDMEPNDEDDRDKAERGAIGLTASAVSSLIPFRAAVRFATGASEYDRDLRMYYQKGVARRAYLRGLFDGQDCRFAQPVRAPRISYKP